jgi:hypothetical protein
MGSALPFHSGVCVAGLFLRSLAASFIRLTASGIFDRRDHAV